jgi:VIT1/CCC1 family predicted Fe2+/Mn2+ transporter
VASDDQRLIEHPINNIGDQFRSALDAFGDETRGELEARSPGWIARIGAAADWADGLSGLLDPRLVAFQSLDSVHQHLVQALNYVPGAPGDESHANQAEQCVGQAVCEAGGLAMAAPPLPELADAIGKKVGRAVSLRATALTRELDDVEARLEAVRQELQDARDEANAADRQRVAEQAQRLDALSQAVDTERARVDNFVTTAINENQQAERDRQKAHEAALKEQKGEFEDLRTELSTKGDETVAKFSEDAKAQFNTAAAKHSELADELSGAAEGVLDHLNKVKAEVDELHEVIVKKGLSGAFAAEADTQAKAANTWRWIAITFGAVAIGVALYTALHAPDKLTWEALIAKLVVSALLGALAAYAGKQSGLHRRRETGAKELELDLTAIGPFLEQLPAEQRAEAIQAFTQRWMTARAIAGPDGSGSPLLVAQITEGLGRFLSSGAQQK